MKQLRPNAINSYNLYKQRKIRRAQYNILVAGVLLIVGTLFVTGRLETDLKWILSIIRGAPLEKDV